uniref:Uncharacterized protein n=1 Tax=Cacopsylla melanoneura TaxID=428564 RepID=A0A8D8TV30_9HEMI
MTRIRCRFPTVHVYTIHNISSYYSNPVCIRQTSLLTMKTSQTSSHLVGVTQRFNPVFVHIRSFGIHNSIDTKIKFHFSRVPTHGVVCCFVDKGIVSIVTVVVTC